MTARDEYERIIDAWYDKDDERRGWVTLYDTLNGRGIWSFAEDDEHGPWWRFGLQGECRISAKVVGSWLRLYVGEEDNYGLTPPTNGEHWFDDAPAMVSWLDLNEPKYDGLSPVAQDLIDYMLPRVIERWSAEDDTAAGDQ